ncbi:hypothetical protein AB0P21_39280 [Kribbella sp. NPDC056861]
MDDSVADNDGSLTVHRRPGSKLDSGQRAEVLGAALHVLAGSAT